MKSFGTRSGTMGLKVHKQEVDCCHLFRRILSTLQTSTYNFVKFLIPILHPLA